MNINVSIIIVNFNGFKYLENLIDSIERIDKENISYEVVFVDNNSTDESVYYLKNNKHEINNLKIIESNKNLGFAAGNNLGAKNSIGENIIFLNNDTMVEKDWLKNILECKKRTGAGIVTSKLVFFYKFLKVTVSSPVKFKKEFTIDTKPFIIQEKFCKNIDYDENYIYAKEDSVLYLPFGFDFESAKVRIEVEVTDKNCFFVVNKDKEVELAKQQNCLDLEINKLDLVDIVQNAGSSLNKNYDGYDIGFFEEDTGQYEREQTCQLACGAAMCISKKDFDLVGGFDDVFFMYYEDTDLSIRVKDKLKKEIIYCPKAVVRHIHAGSSIEWSPFFCFYVYRNKLLFLLKNYQKKIFFYFYIRFILKIIKDFFSCNLDNNIKLAEIKSFFSVCRHVTKYLIKSIIK